MLLNGEFDSATDFLVIAQWYNLENGDNNTIYDINSRLMAWNSIGISIFYKIICCIYNNILQFCDLLLFEDTYTYNAHKRVVQQVKNRFTTSTTATTMATGHVNANNEQILLDFVISTSTKTTDSISTPKTKNKDQKNTDEEKEGKENEDDNTVIDEFDEYFANRQTKLLLKGVDHEAIESTMRLKCIRSLETLFESTPPAVLRLVYLMRTSEFVISGGEAIVIILYINMSINNINDKSNVSI